MLYSTGKFQETLLKPVLMWKIENIPNELSDLVKISRPSVGEIKKGYQGVDQRHKNQNHLDLKMQDEHS